MLGAVDRGLEHFDLAIVEDRGPGVEVLQTVKREADADHELRLTESQVRALLEYDRAIATTREGDRVVVEMIPDEDRCSPVEVRSLQAEADHGGGST